MRDMIDYAIRLLRAGYVPLRLEPNGKFTKAEGWTVDTPTEDKLQREFARPSNIGARMGDMHKDGTCIIGIDIDIENAQLIRCVERAIGKKVPVKRGKKGYTYLLRMDREIKSHKIYWTRDGKKTAAIDILARGAQTVLPPSIHPDTKLPYTWVAGPPLDTIAYGDLPVFGPALLDEIRGFCKNEDDNIYKLNDMEWLGAGGGGNTHDTCHAAVATMLGRNWTDEEIMERIIRAKRESVEAAGETYDWPESHKVIQEWIDSGRSKNFDVPTKKRMDDIPTELFNRYGYVISLDRIYDMKKGALLAKTQFDNIHARDFAKPWATILVSPDLRIFDKLTYAPGQPKFCKEKSFDSDAILDCINVWTPSECQSEDDGDRYVEEADIAPWLELVTDLFDQDKEAINHVLSFMAFTVQYPGQRINHALVVQGSQGIGKDSIFIALSRVLGIQNSSQVTLQHVESAFNEWLFGKQFIIFQEMLAPGRRAIYNKLKTYITDEYHTINTKHLNLQRLHNRANYIFLTNYMHALSIDPDDRRMWVWHSKMKPKSTAFYEKFYKWLGDKRSIDSLYTYLLNYDTSKFKPTAPPPMTDGKRTMVKASSSEIEQFLREAYENGTWPMASDLISITHLMSALRPVFRVSTGMITEALDHICGRDGEIDVRPRIKGDQGKEARIRLRAIRNVERWRTAEGPELIEEYRMPTPPGQGETEGSYLSLTTSEARKDRY